MASEDRVFVAVEIRALVIDPTTDAPVVILQEESGTSLLPIWIGGFEAHSIAMAVEGIDPPRPLTHDLLQSVIKGTGYKVTGIQIHSLEDGVFKALVRLVSEGPDKSVLEFDARPSDAIALALREKALIEVSKDVLDLAHVEKQSIDEALKTLLEKLDPEDLGQYEM